MRGRPLPDDEPDRSRGPRRDDDWRPSSGGRPPRRSPDGPPGDWDSGRRGSVNGRGLPTSDENWDRGERGRPPRDDRRDPYDERGGRDGRDGRGMDRPGDRSMRGPRPPVRDDDWDGPPRGRGGAPAGAAGARTRAPGRGGLWADDEPMRRPDGSDPRGRTMGGRIDPHDPRSLRRGLVDTSAAPAVPEKKKGGLSFGKAILVILLMFVVGAGAAFGYWKFTTPPLPSDASAPSATPATTSAPSGTPNASPNATAKPTQHSFSGPARQITLVTVSRA